MSNSKHKLAKAPKILDPKKLLTESASAVMGAVHDAQEAAFAFPQNSHPFKAEINKAIAAKKEACAGMVDIFSLWSDFATNVGADATKCANNLFEENSKVVNKLLQKHTAPDLLDVGTKLVTTNFAAMTDYSLLYQQRLQELFSSMLPAK